jgi:hypothetical protein
MRAAGVWMLLVAMTSASWSLADVPGACVLILVLALVKARLVGIHFMGLRRAPIALRALFEIWCGSVCLTIVALLLLA